MDDKSLVDYYLLKYRVELLKNEFIAAENTLIMALNFAKNMDMMKKAGEISIVLGKFYMENNKEVMAAKYLSEGVTIFRGLGILKEI